VDGIVRVVKPPGMTSHEVVGYVRSLWGVKAGHTGTLDRAAAGLLVLCVGSATRLAQYLVACDKSYRAEITFGISTTTYDAEGAVTQQRCVPYLTAEQVQTALGGFTGSVPLQVPAYSAMRRDGERLYQRARRGEQVDLPVRQVQIHRWELIEFVPGDYPRAVTEIECSAGTYVRSLAVMIGERLSVPAYLSFLVRTRVGSHHLAAAVTLEELTNLTNQAIAQTVIVPPAEAVAHLPQVVVDAPIASYLRHGTAQEIQPQSTQPPAQAAILTKDHNLLCIAEVEESNGRWRLQPRTVLSPSAGQLTEENR